MNHKLVNEEQIASTQYPLPHSPPPPPGINAHKQNKRAPKKGPRAFWNVSWTIRDPFEHMIRAVDTSHEMDPLIELQVHLGGHGLSKSSSATENSFSVVPLMPGSHRLQRASQSNSGLSTHQFRLVLGLPNLACTDEPGPLFLEDCHPVCEQILPEGGKCHKMWYTEWCWLLRPVWDCYFSRRLY